MNPVFLVRRLQNHQYFFGGFFGDSQKSRKRLHKQEDVLKGQRGIRFPMISLTSEKEMQVSRHLLSQKVVGGTMVIHPPFQQKKSSQTLNQNSRSKFWRKNG
jgi:hypothetical protein